MNIPRLLRALLGTDVVVATLLILIATLLIAFVSFYLAWLNYEDRYGISFMDFVRITF